MTADETLWFPERRMDGAFPVIDADGAVVARVTAAWTGGRFSVTNPVGAPLCAGTTSRRWLAGSWQVTDAAGAPLLAMTAKPLRHTATVQLARGGELTIRGSAWRRDFVVVDADGAAVLTVAPRTSALSPSQDDYAVHQHRPGRLSVAEVIAVVQVWRMVKKSDAALLTATASTATTAGP